VQHREDSCEHRGRKPGGDDQLDQRETTAAHHQ
jgi:hypothetical protein